MNYHAEHGRSGVERHPHIRSSVAACVNRGKVCPGLSTQRAAVGFSGEHQSMRRRSRRRTPATDIGDRGLPIGSINSEHACALAGSLPLRISI